MESQNRSTVASFFIGLSYEFPPRFPRTRRSTFYRHLTHTLQIVIFRKQMVHTTIVKLNPIKMPATGRIVDRYRILLENVPSHVT